MRTLRSLGLAAMCLAGVPLSAAADEVPAVGLIGAAAENEYAHWALPRQLRDEADIHVATLRIDGISADTLREFNAVMVTGLGRIEAGFNGGNEGSIGQARYDEVVGLLVDYVRDGGSLYIYGASMTHGNDARSHEAVNGLLHAIGDAFGLGGEARIAFHQIDDDAREATQSGGLGLRYALADGIADHPATNDVFNYWYPVDLFAYGPWTKPLVLGGAWTPLIRTSADFDSSPVDPIAQPTARIDCDGASPPAACAPLPPMPEGAPIYAALQLPDVLDEQGALVHAGGRVILNGGESMLSFFDYEYSDFADFQTGKVGMETGLPLPEGGPTIPSDGVALIASSLTWLVEPSLGRFGGHVPRPLVSPTPSEPLTWDSEASDVPVMRSFRGVIGALPVGAGGNATIDELAEAARALSLDFLLITADFEQLAHSGAPSVADPEATAAWQAIVQQCEGQSDGDLLVLPALLTRDEQGNRFVTAGARALPAPSRLSERMPLRLRDHLPYWFHDAHSSFRAPFWFSRGHHPPELFSGYSGFAIHTWLDNDPESFDDALAGYFHNQSAGDRALPFAMTMLTDADLMAGVPETTSVFAQDLEEVASRFLTEQYDASKTWISSGPVIEHWGISFGTRHTNEAPYVAGRERFALNLRARSDVGLRWVTIYDHGRVWRRFAGNGATSLTRVVDGLHERRHDFVLVAEDLDGGRAVTGDLETSDTLMRAFMLADRSNSSSATLVRTPPGERQKTYSATHFVYKTGLLGFATTWAADEVPGFDGSGAVARLSVDVQSNLGSVSADPAERSELTPPVHEIRRPYDSADVIVFDTPIVKGCRTRDCGCTDAICQAYGGRVFGHTPYADLSEPKRAASLRTYDFYRTPHAPSAVLADFTTEITDPAGEDLVACGRAFALDYLRTPYLPDLGDVVLLRPDGTQTVNPAGYAELSPGDAIVFPKLRETLLVVEDDGALPEVFFSIGSETALLFGRTRPSFPASGVCAQWQEHLPAGHRARLRMMHLKTAFDPNLDAVAQAADFRDRFGIGLAPPAYTVSVARGSVTSTRYVLEIAGDDHAFRGTVSAADLPQPLPIKVTGLNPDWTVAKIDLGRDEWFPLGTLEGAAFTTIDTRGRAHDLFIGNVVTTTVPEMKLTLLTANADGRVYVDVHNPTEEGADVPVRVAVSSFLGREQTTCPVHVPAGETVRVEMRQGLQPDLDEDNVPDACDEDVDGDGIANLMDVCPRDVDASQADLDTDGIGDVCDPDDDDDIVLDEADNCPTLENGDQLDSDGDSRGDACDLDDDGDGLSDHKDECPKDAPGPNDLLGDGCPDQVCDIAVFLRKLAPVDMKSSLRRASLIRAEAACDAYLAGKVRVWRSSLLALRASTWALRGQLVTVATADRLIAAINRLLSGRSWLD